MFINHRFSELGKRKNPAVRSHFTKKPREKGTQPHADLGFHIHTNESFSVNAIMGLCPPSFLFGFTSQRTEKCCWIANFKIIQRMSPEKDCIQEFLKQSQVVG